LEEHESFVFDFVFDSVKKRLISASDDRTVHVWDVYTGKVLSRILHPNTIWCCGLTPLGDIITGCGDGVVRIFTEHGERYAEHEMIKEYQFSTM